MTQDEKQRVIDLIQHDNFDHAFMYATDFTGNDAVEDPQFHQMVERYIAVRSALAQYIGYDQED